MTSETIPVGSAEIVKGQPAWTRCARPGQRFVGSALLPGAKGSPVLYDIYVYGKNAEAIGLRYGNHPRDEYTHTAGHWNRLKTPLALALKQALSRWIRRPERQSSNPV